LLDKTHPVAKTDLHAQTLSVRDAAYRWFNYSKQYNTKKAPLKGALLVTHSFWLLGVKIEPKKKRF